MSYKKKYKSLMGATGLITAPNYLAEMIVVKRAEKKGIKLPDCIWKKEYKSQLQYKYWHNAYFGELVHASRILKEFDEDCVIQALQSYECKVILSLRNAKLKRVAAELQKQKEIQESFKENNELHIGSTMELPKRQVKKKSKRGKLK